MSEVLDALYAASAFKPQPGRSQLGFMHVPFDQLTGTTSCEARAQDALRGHRRVVVAGGMGTGKSSLIEWLVDLAGGGTLREQTEGYFPIRVPLRVDSPEVATDRGAFLGHLAATVRRASALQLGAPAAPRAGTTTWSVTPRVALPVGEIGVELAREVEQVVPSGPAPAHVHVEALQSVFGRLEASGLLPVVVFDDADAWLDTAWQPDAAVARRRFFATIPRLLAEELDAATILAALPSYLADPEFEAARGFLGPIIAMPELDDPRQVGEVAAAHARTATGDRSLTLGAFIEPPALALLHERYRQRRHDLRHTLTVLDTALTRARDQGGTIIERRDIAHALLDVPLQ